MVIGIDASRAFLKRRTGIEEYSYQVIKHLREAIPLEHHVILYIRKHIGKENAFNEIDFTLPPNWRVEIIRAPIFCTQVVMAWKLLQNMTDVLFVPLHTLLLLHPLSQMYAVLLKLVRKPVKKLRKVIVVHGLEYEFCQEAYSLKQRTYMRAAIKYSCLWAERVIAVSKNTKKDVMRLYSVPEEKISVIYEGYEQGTGYRGQGIENAKSYPSPSTLHPLPYLLFIGRLEERKNVVRIIEAFEILKEKHGLPHQLVLAGKPGFGYERIRAKIQNSRFKDHIREVGYVSEDEKWSLLQDADVFLFPTLYEGFGIPVLEAQSVGVPVVTSYSSSLPEVAGEGAVFVDPLKPESIATGIREVLMNQPLRDDIIGKGRANASLFSWEKCAREVAGVILSR